MYCFARGSHRYLEMSPGRDFDSQIVVKTNVAEVLGREVSRPSWSRKLVALGTNTDPYQRAEGRYRLMPGIIRTLAMSHTPFSILTKGTLLRRDLPELAEASDRIPVSLAMSIAIGEDPLQQVIEPGTPTTRARLETVAAASAAGLPCDVFVMPVLPGLTDSPQQLDHLLREISAAGARSVVYGPLHLRTHVKPWFFDWLEQYDRGLVPRYRAMYPGIVSQAPREYRSALAGRIRPLLRKHGLERPAASRARGARSDPPVPVRVDDVPGAPTLF
ncbi:Rv2578c family radical SAM protein [Leucobacter tardus]